MNDLPPVPMDALIAEARAIFAARRTNGQQPAATPAPPVLVCQGCGGPLSPLARKWCSEPCRKSQYASHCEDCGTRISPRGERTRCPACANRHRALWDRDLILARFKEWERRFGRPPSAAEWSRTMARLRGFDDVVALLDRESGHWPHSRTVAYVFGSWRAGLEAAGMTTNRPGRGRTPIRDAA